jgi:signal transduction histidine kinase
MIEKSLITRTEREIYLGYERERRVRMLRAITPAFIAVCAFVAAILSIVLLVLPESARGRGALLGTVVMLSCCIVLLWLGLLAARREWLNLSTALVAGTSALGTSSSLAIWGIYLGIDPFAMLEITPFSVVIVLAGLLGNIRWIALATGVMNGATVLLLLVLPRASGLGPIFSGEMPLLIPIAVAHQWLFAVLMIIIWQLFRRTLGEIGVAYERAQQLDALKDEFIASVNHELRTPLMTMQTYLETIRDSSEQLPPDELRSVLDQVCRVGDSLVELVQSILSTRQIDRESKTFASEPVSVKQALDDAVQLIDPRAGQHIPRDLILDVPEDLVIWGERVRLQQVLTNLLSNAVKYSAPGTPIEIRARTVEQQAAATRGRRTRATPSPVLIAEITIRDYGHGIPPEQLHLLFNRFVRLPRDLASKVTGTGLGLYLCRILVESMGGRIWAESTGEDGEGSAFHLTLPAAPTDVHAREIPGATVALQAGRI